MKSDRLSAKLVGIDSPQTLHPFGRATLDNLVGVIQAGDLVSLRVNFDIKVKDGRPEDDTRILAALKTIRFLSGLGARILLFSHNGRPLDKIRKGASRAEVEAELSLTPAIERLRELLGPRIPVHLVDTFTGSTVEAAVDSLQAGGVLAFPNIRLEERAQSKIQTVRLAFIEEVFKYTGVPKVYVNEAFPASHRQEASITEMAIYVKDQGGFAVMGRSMQEELTAFEPVVRDTPHPFITVIGGAKISGKEGKLKMLEGLASRADAVVIGGAMLWAFLTAGRYHVGEDPIAHLRNPQKGETAEADIEAARQLLDSPLGSKFVLIKKIVVSNGSPNPPTIDLERGEWVPDGFAICDCDSNAVTKAMLDLRMSLKGRPALILWNGPLGRFEDGFGKGTLALINQLEFETGEGCITLAGGGSTVTAIKDLKAEPVRLSHIATGGGATLELIEKGTLPGIEVLSSAA